MVRVGVVVDVGISGSGGSSGGSGVLVLLVLVMGAEVMVEIDGEDVNAGMDKDAGELFREACCCWFCGWERTAETEGREALEVSEGICTAGEPLGGGEG